MTALSLFDFKERIKERYGYDEDFAQNIALATESLIDYMGYDLEGIIKDAVLSCRFIIAKTQNNTNNQNEPISETLNREGLEAPFVSANRGYISIPKIDTVGEEKKVTHVDRVIVLPHNFNMDSPALLAEMIRSMLTLVMSYVNEYKIDGDTLTKRSGLSSSKYNIPTKTKLEDSTMGLEEGLVEYDTLSIMRESHDSKFDDIRHDYTRVIAGFLEDSIGLKEVFQAAVIQNDMEALKRVFDSSLEIGYQGFNELVDKIKKLEDRRKSSLDGEEIKEIMKELSEYFSETICPQVNALAQKLAPEKSTRLV